MRRLGAKIEIEIIGYIGACIRVNDRLLFYEGLKEIIERTEERNREDLNEGYSIDNHFSLGLYEFRGLLGPLYENGELGKLADYFELLGTANRNLYRDHNKYFWWIYPPLVWLLCSSFYNYRTGRNSYAANLARFNYSYMEEVKPGLTHGFTRIEIGLTERGLFEELMGYFSLLFDPNRFISHMNEAKKLFEQHIQLREETSANSKIEDDEDLSDPGGIDEQTIVHEFSFSEANQPFDIALILCFEINERTYWFKEREQIFDRLKTFFTDPPDWSAMKKPSLNISQLHLDPDQ